MGVSTLGLWIRAACSCNSDVLHSCNRYSDLVTPIMENGGRRAMYRLMGLPEPAAPRIKKKSAPKLAIDRKGESDKARYSGLKMTQAMDDEAMGAALEEAQRKVKNGESLRKRLVEEDYVVPYAGEKESCSSVGRRGASMDGKRSAIGVRRDRNCKFVCFQMGVGETGIDKHTNSPTLNGPRVGPSDNI